jgi:hypothetical protein
VSGLPTWADHEDWLTGFLEPLHPHELLAPLAVVFDGGVSGWLVDSRPERADDEVDPLTELAVVLAELAPDAAVVATPTRVRELEGPDREVVGRAWTLTSIERRADGEGYDLRARMLPAGGLGRPSDLDIEMSPVASVLDDAVRHRLGASPVHALYAAAKWGHRLYATGHDEEGLDEARPAEDVQGGGAVHDAEAASHHLRRHARDLAARHLPTAPWPQPLRRPAIHASTPDGWGAACPI